MLELANVVRIVPEMNASAAPNYFPGNVRSM
jgi:hypothetical protein